jgi:uncharacterized protein
MSIKITRLALIFIFLVSVLAAILSSHLKFDYNFESFFPQDDPELDFYNSFRKEFGTDNDYIILGIENKQGVFQKPFLKSLQALTDSLKNLNHITSVLSPVTQKSVIVAPLGGYFEIPYLHIEDESLYPSDSARIFNNAELMENFFSKDAKSVALYIRTVDNPSKLRSDSIINSLENLLSHFHFDKIHIAGKVKAQQVYLKKMEDELFIFIIASALLVIFFLVIAFRSFWGVWLPLLVVALAVLWTFGFMQATGKEIDLLTTLMPTILFVVGMSDVVHIISKYLDELRQGLSKKDAIKKSIKEVGLATFLTSLTTSIGFITLASNGIQPVKEFGLYLAAGVFIALILSLLIIPAVFLELPRPDVSKKKMQSLFWVRVLNKLLLFIFKNSKYVGMAFLLVSVLSLFGISKIKVNSVLLEDLNKEMPLKKSFMFFEDHFSGVRPFEMVLELKDPAQNVFDEDVMRDLDKIDSYLTNSYGVGYVISPVTIVKSASRAINGGGNDYYQIPPTDEYQKLKQKLQAYGKRKEFKSVISDEGRKIRFTGKLKDKGSHHFRLKNEELNKFIGEEIGIHKISYTLTGAAHLIDKSTSGLAINLLVGLSFAFAVIALIVAFMFRSFRMVLIALVPNVLPLIMIGGIMGFSGIDLKISTAVIFTIAFGIAVDDTIHFFSRLKIELSKGKSGLYALKRTFISTGKAIILTSIILCGGFLTLVFSDFESTFYIGILVSLTLFFAILADLFLLPVLLLWNYRIKNKKS